jgi:serine protease
MRNLATSAVLVLVLLLASCNRTDQLETFSPLPDLSLQNPIEPLNQRAPLSKVVINRLVLQKLQSENRFDWAMVDAYTTWSAAVATDSLLSIGYQPEGFQNLEDRIHEIDVNAPEWAAVKQALIDFIVAEENLAHPDQPVTAEDILAFGEKPLPYFNVKVGAYETIAKLREMKVVRYAEPMSYGTEEAGRSSGSGCGGGPASSLPSSDYTTVSPGAKVSWNYYNHNIPAAWNQSQGDNITVGVIDTGVSPNQDKLNSNFSSGWSTNRFRSKTGFFVTGWWWWASIDGPDDDCGHGTSMAGTIAAPRTNAGSTVGVAYKSNLVSVRATDDVVINEGAEKDGVSDAFYYLGNRNDVKIISMSLGDVFSSGQVADAVRYANNRGKLIFCAAGTSLSWTSWWGVIFPASMSETVAVTGVKTGSSRQRCTVCHDGSAVDFVVEMEDGSNSNRTPITLAMSGNTPKYTGGSSVATATTAGMAALVWARSPSMSKGMVLNKLKAAADYYPNRNGNFGWGKIDALSAVNAVQ